MELLFYWATIDIARSRKNKDLRFLLTLCFFLSPQPYTLASFLLSPLSRLFSIQEKNAIKLSFFNNKSPWKWFAKFQIPSQLKKNFFNAHKNHQKREIDAKWVEKVFHYFSVEIFSLFMSLIKVSREEN